MENIQRCHNLARKTISYQCSVLQVVIKVVVIFKNINKRWEFINKFLCRVTFLCHKSSRTIDKSKYAFSHEKFLETMVFGILNYKKKKKKKRRYLEGEEI